MSFHIKMYDIIATIINKSEILIFDFIICNFMFLQYIHKLGMYK